MSQNTSFGSLFKKYRLLAGYDSVSSFAEELANRGYPFEDSIIYKWQSGQRVPKERDLMISILKTFVDKSAIGDVETANSFLESADHKKLTVEEAQELGLANTAQIFQAPAVNKAYIDRSDLTNDFLNEDKKGKLVVFCGPTGVGKTALVAHLCHILRSKYEDGVFWYALEKENVTDVLKSLLSHLDESKFETDNKQVLSSHLRTALTNKNVLLVLDNVEDFDQVKLFLPNSNKCTVFLLSRNSEIDLEQEFEKVEVKPFNKNEVLAFFKAKLKNNFDPKLANHYLKVSELVKGVPSALNIVADQIKQSNIFSTEQKTDIPAKLPHYYILSGLFSLLTILWLGEKMMNISPSKAFTFSYWLVPLYGSVIGFSSARKMVKNFSIFFYPVLFLAIGLLMQVFGQLSYSYYQFIYLFYADRTFVHGIPYPSTGDIGYFGSVVFYILSLSCLIYNLKNKWSPKSNVYITLALLIFCIFLTTSYTTLLRGVIFDFQNPIKLILDLGYPLGQSIYVSLAVFAFILSTGFLGGYLNKPVLVMLSGLIIQFVADTMFIYQANLGTWVYGNLNDYLYLVAYFITSIGIVKLGNTVINSTQNNVAISKVSNIFKKIFAINNVIFSLFSLLVIVWVVEKVLKLWTQDIYTAIYFSMALFGGLLGLVTVKLIGNIHKPLSKALLGLSLGLLGQVFGQLVYEYYYLTSGIELAYPSVGEMGYFGSIFFYIYAAYQFILMLRSKQYSLRIVNFVISIILPLVFLIGSYYIFLNGRTFAHINTIKVVLDIGYPLFQSVYVSLAIFAFILSRGYIGGIFNRSASIILAGFITQYIADSMFVYQFSLGTWTAGGVNDLIFTVAYTLMTLGIASFHRAITVNAYNN